MDSPKRENSRRRFLQLAASAAPAAVAAVAPNATAGWQQTPRKAAVCATLNTLASISNRLAFKDANHSRLRDALG